MPSALPGVDREAIQAMAEAKTAELDAAIKRVMLSGHYILGPELEAFEKEFSAWFGTAGTVGVANGTDAIELALLAVARQLPKVVGHEVPGQVAKAGRILDLHPEPDFVADIRSKFA